MLSAYRTQLPEMLLHLASQEMHSGWNIEQRSVQDHMPKWNVDTMFSHSWRRGSLDFHTEEGSEACEFICHIEVPYLMERVYGFRYSLKWLEWSKMYLVESEEFRQWCMTLRNTGYLDLSIVSVLFQEIGSVFVLWWGMGDTYSVGSIRKR
jgi:hypothetical protein